MPVRNWNNGYCGDYLHLFGGATGELSGVEHLEFKGDISDVFRDALLNMLEKEKLEITIPSDLSVTFSNPESSDLGMSEEDLEESQKMVFDFLGIPYSK